MISNIIIVFDIILLISSVVLAAKVVNKELWSGTLENLADVGELSAVLVELDPFLVVASFVLDSSKSTDLIVAFLNGISSAVNNGSQFINLS